MSNLRQIAIGNEQYLNDNNDFMPIQTSSIGWSSYTHGGRYPVPESRVSRGHTPWPGDRPLNNYVHPNLPAPKQGGDVPVTDVQDPDKYNFPIFECPADESYNYQEGGSGLNGEPKHGLSSYHAIGTSYTFNLTWGDFLNKYSDQFERVPLSDAGWEEGVQLYRRARMNVPSQFVSYFEDPADWAYWLRATPSLTHHGTKEVYSMAFLDGHAALVEADCNVPNTTRYMLFFPEKRRGN